MHQQGRGWRTWKICQVSTHADRSGNQGNDKTGYLRQRSRAEPTSHVSLHAMAWTATCASQSRWYTRRRHHLQEKYRRRHQHNGSDTRILTGIKTKKVGGASPDTSYSSMDHQARGNQNRRRQLQYHHRMQSGQQWCTVNAIRFS